MAKAKKQVGKSSMIKDEPVILSEQVIEQEPEVSVTETDEVKGTVTEVVDEKKTESPSLSTPVSVIDDVLKEEYKERVEKSAEVTGELTNEEKIVNFVEKSTGNLVKLNDFLKSLYPSLIYNEPPVWKRQITSRQIRLMITQMHNNGLIKVVNSTHNLLGDCYFDAEGKARHYNLDTIQIFCEK